MDFLLPSRYLLARWATTDVSRKAVGHWVRRSANLLSESDRMMIIQDLKWLRTGRAASSELVTNGLPECINTKWISGLFYIRNRSCHLNEVIMGGGGVAGFERPSNVHANPVSSLFSHVEAQRVSDVSEILLSQISALSCFVSASEVDGLDSFHSPSERGKRDRDSNL
jgi:hypothetical protein